MKINFATCMFFAILNTICPSVSAAISGTSSLQADISATIQQGSCSIYVYDTGGRVVNSVDLGDIYASQIKAGVKVTKVVTSQGNRWYKIGTGNCHQSSGSPVIYNVTPGVCDGTGFVNQAAGGDKNIVLDLYTKTTDGTDPDSIVPGSELSCTGSTPISIPEDSSGRTRWLQFMLRKADGAETLQEGSFMVPLTFTATYN
ncbi:hypothetical protein [Dryocola sp. BD626]|uniref:hypothetical protein n=1 Tax=Dryocola sp. BD626 TaxID=3133273 RepID=UPI003F4F79D7